MWVAVGQGTNTIAYSTNNGTDWTAVTNSTSFFTNGRDIVWNGSMWVAVGGGNVVGGTSIAYSHDGINWLNALNSPLSQGLGIIGNSKIGANIEPSTIVINKENILDITSESYYNKGPKNISITTNAHIL